MPEMGGIDTLKELKIRHRDIGVILMTDEEPVEVRSAVN